jgi:membrane associated rhomboid family serine protease
MQILGLSSWGIKNYFFWQFISYLFVSPVTYGISFSFLITIAFNAYLLWIIGNMVMERKGIGHFFTVYFGTGIAAGLIVSWLQFVSGSPTVFSGSSAALYGILMTWLMLHPNAEMLLFLTIPFKAKWLVVGLIGANLLIDLSIGDWLNACAYLTAAIVSYFYCVLVWNCKGPFTSLSKLERALIACTRFFRKTPPSFPYPQAKIYDFKTGQAILKDEEFMDAMLTKISLYGESSLTWKEKWRMKRISKNKKKLKNPS